MLNTRPSQHGFTLIEAMIGISIMSILMLMAMPSFSAWSNNQKIRSAAEGVLNGLQTARMEALKLNQAVEFILTDSAPTSSSVTASTSGKNWIVRNSIDGTNYDLIAGWNGSPSTNASSAVSYGSSVSTVTFNSLGRNASNSTLSFDFSISTAGTCKAAGGDLRCLRVNVTSGGEIRMCDPSVTATGDTRKC